ncbi:MAG: MucR family transcriptional regulator [Pseudomonadota bacterium]
MSSSTPQIEDQATHMNLLEITGDVVAAYVGNNPVSSTELPNLLEEVFARLSKLSNLKTAAQSSTTVPAVPIKKSVHDDYLICLEDGKRFKTLKRHLRSKYNMSPDDYRAKWGLPGDYPMVAPGYAKRRSNLAVELGLGRKPGTKIKK